VFSPSTTGEQFPIVLPDYVHLIGTSRETSILDAEADSDKESRVIKIVEECENIKVANFTITGGNAVSAGCIGGGGILVTHPDLEYVYDGPVSPVNAVFENLIVTDNSATAGGGISIWRVSGPTLSNLIIQENTSEVYGGGLMIFTSVASVTDVTVSGNNCNTDDSFGGGIIINNSEATLTNVTVTDNTASFGGGMSVGNSDATLTHVTISGNTATTSGGGFLSTPYSNNTLTNSIIWDNSPQSIYAFLTTTISYSDIQGGWDGEGNIDTDPLFTDAGNGDHTLQPDSPCIDAGTADLDGDGIEDITDYVGLAPDMGAFEYGSTVSVNDPGELPQKYALHQNYPNPFNPVTTFRYNLPEDGLVNITIYDIMGRQVRNLISNQQSAGYKSVQWNATNNAGQQVSAGLYLYTIQAGEFRQTKKMVLLK